MHRKTRLACWMREAGSPSLVSDPAMLSAAMPDTRFLHRVVLRDYKSIRHCDLALPPFAVLVGPNGSGKSNFLDALRFVAEALRESLDYALSSRGGAAQVVRRSIDSRDQFGMRIDCALANSSATYGFAVRAEPDGSFQVVREDCTAVSRHSAEVRVHYSIRNGRIVSCSASRPPQAMPDRLYLRQAADIAGFGPVFDSLSRMGLYSLNPESIRTPRPPDAGNLLSRDGSNLANVLHRIGERSPETKQLIEDYLACAVPGIAGVDCHIAGSDAVLEFCQRVGIDSDFLRFSAASMSDGTLRVLGMLVALFQDLGDRDRKQDPRLIGIEEPEYAVHPDALELLGDVLMHAAEHSQVVVTSHSTDLLDRSDIAEESIFTVSAEDGETRIGSMSEGTRSVLRERLSTPGELMRMNQLHLATTMVKSERPPSSCFDSM